MVFKDQLFNKIQLKDFPKRIISLVPSQTELLYDLGLGDRVVGITKFCIHPNKWYKTKSRVGGTKHVDLDKVRALNPDLIIGNKEENQKENIEELRKIAPVWMSDIFDINDSYKMIKQIGEICNVEENANNLIKVIKDNFEGIKTSLIGKKVMYFIWKDPYIGVAQNTFIDYILEQELNMKNCFADLERYPTIENLDAYSPDFIFLSSEPYPFKEKHIDFFKNKYPKARVVLVDGEYFSWYGSRLVGAPEYFNKLQEEILTL